MPCHGAILVVLAALVGVASTAGSVSPAAAAERDGAAWRAPLDGAISRPFSVRPGRPYSAGQHRGVDLRAATGAVVRSPCAGTVRFVGAVPGIGTVITLRCDGRLATLSPLRAVRVREGARVASGSTLARLAPGHGASLHLSARRVGDRAYVDPGSLLGSGAPDGPVLAPLGRAPNPSRPPRAAPRRRTVRGPRARRLTARRPATSPSVGRVPWPVWPALGALLFGLAGGRLSPSAAGPGRGSRSGRHRRVHAGPTGAAAPEAPA